MKNLLPHFIIEQFQNQNWEGGFETIIMFVDVSGFTPMTEALMKHGDEGAEVLSRILNKVFEPMVNAVYERGGFIAGFAGDAFSAIFPQPCEGSKSSIEGLSLDVKADGFIYFAYKKGKMIRNEVKSTMRMILKRVINNQPQSIITKMTMNMKMEHQF